MDEKKSGWDTKSLRTAAILMVVIIVLGFVAAFLVPETVEIEHKLDDMTLLDYLEYLALLAVVATAIERATQSILLLTGTNGTERAVSAQTGNKTKDGTRAAMMISLPLGFAVALAGIGVIEPLVQIDTSLTAETAAQIVKAFVDAGGVLAELTAEVVSAQTVEALRESVGRAEKVLRGVDTIVTAGVLAGGASAVHQVAEAVKRLVPGQHLARANVLAGEPIPSDASLVLRLERGAEGATLWHGAEAYPVAGADAEVQNGKHRHVALRGATPETMFFEFPFTTADNRAPKITTPDLADGTLSMKHEDLKTLTTRLGNVARTDLTIVVRTVA